MEMFALACGIIMNLRISNKEIREHIWDLPAEAEHKSANQEHINVREFHNLAMVVSRMHRQNIVLVTRKDDILKWSIV